VAVGMLMSLPGVTKEQYEQVNQKMWGKSPMPPEDAPEGLIVHTAGSTPEGWYVYDIWESKEHFQRFAEDKLAPATQAIAGGQMGGEPQFFAIHSLVQAK
jgi:hypothetical protein